MVTFSGLKFARKIPIFTISGQEPVSLRTASITAGNVTRAEAGTVRFFSERGAPTDSVGPISLVALARRKKTDLEKDCGWSSPGYRGGRHRP